MSKRLHEETKEERWQRKLKRYEKKLYKRGRMVEEQTEGLQDPEPVDWFEGYDEYPASTHDYSYIASPTAGGDPKSPLLPLPLPAEPEVMTEIAVAVETQETASNSTFEVDPNLLEALGAFEEEKTEWGEAIVDQVGMRLKPLLLNGLKKEEKEILLKKFPFPKNLTLAKAPTLNAEVNAMLNEANRNRDKRLCNKQNQLGTALSGVTKAMSLLLCKEHKTVDILSILSDTSKLLADSHYLETDTRKSLVMPLVDKELIETFKDRKRDEFLFGDKIGELVKNSRGIRKTGQLIKAPSTNLNSRGPSSRGRQTQSQKSYVTRGGGHQRPYRRRAAPLQSSAAPLRRQQPARRPPAAPTQPRGTSRTATTTDGTTGTTQ